MWEKMVTRPDNVHSTISLLSVEFNQPHAQASVFLNITMLACTPTSDVRRPSNGVAESTGPTVVPAKTGNGRRRAEVGRRLDCAPDAASLSSVLSILPVRGQKRRRVLFARARDAASDSVRSICDVAHSSFRHRRFCHHHHHSSHPLFFSPLPCHEMQP